jgi:acetyltransferase-like isoleucine patch superfamily enzyme
MDSSLVIIGNSSAARECYWMACEIFGDALRFKGFLAFEGYAGKLRELVDRELGVDDGFTPAADDVFVIGIASPTLRLRAYDKWKARGGKFIDLVHPAASLPAAIQRGEANIIGCACHFSCNVNFGNANYFNGSVVVGHDTHIGDGNFFGPFALVLGDSKIGSGNSFGVHSVTLAGAKIGNNNTIAPGAYVYKGCGDNRIMAGNPALRMD